MASNAQDRTFTLSTETTELPLIVTQRALDDFCINGLEAMDECLITSSERMVPANDPQKRINPLDMVGRMMLDGAATGNTSKVVLCALWLTHHYPKFTGLMSNGNRFHFITGQRAPASQATAAG